MSDFAGALVSLFTLLVPLAFRDFRRDGRTLVAYWIVLSLYHAVAVVNAYFFTTLGADADAATFQRISVELAARGEWTFHVGSKFYEQMLGLVYRTFGPSHLMGQELSILAFAFSCVVFLKLMRLLDCRRYSWAVLLFFGGLPTMVLLGSVTLRESYQILFFMLAVYLAVKFHAERRARRFFAMVLAALAMGLFHKGLMLYALFMIVIVGLWKVERAHRAGPIWTARPVIWAYALSGVGLVLSLPAIAPDTAGLEAVRAVLSGEALEFAAQFRERSVEARATYGLSLDTSSYPALVLSSLPVVLYYFVAPFPWQVGNALDLYAALEVAWRLVLIGFSIKAWREAQGPVRGLFGLLLVLYFSMGVLWALGTLNYGTAIRHHMVHYWIIVLIGGPRLMVFLQRLARTVLVPAAFEARTMDRA